MTTTSKIYFENERYYVTLEGSEVVQHGAPYGPVYGVVNKETNVIEFKVPQLPEAIHAAESLDVAMAKEAWSWIRDESPSGAADLAAAFGVVNPDGSTDDEVH